MNSSFNRKAFIVVGGRSPIAISCSKFLAEFGPVLHVTRSPGTDISAFFENSDVELIEQDLAEPFAGANAARKALALQPAIAGIAFLQRFRAERAVDQNVCELPANSSSTRESLGSSHLSQNLLHLLPLAPEINRSIFDH